MSHRLIVARISGQSVVGNVTKLAEVLLEENVKVWALAALNPGRNISLPDGKSGAVYFSGFLLASTLKPFGRRSR